MSARAALGEVFQAALANDAKQALGLDLDMLKVALAKVKRRKSQPANDQEPFTQVEIDALSAWMNLQILAEGKMTREERSDRNKAAWNAGDRRRWGGDLRERDKRRGWRNFARGRR